MGFGVQRYLSLSLSIYIYKHTSKTAGFLPSMSIKISAFARTWSLPVVKQILQLQVEIVGPRWFQKMLESFDDFSKRWGQSWISSKKFVIWWCKANEMKFGFHKLNTWSSVQRVLCWGWNFIKFQAVVLDVFQDLQVQKSIVSCHAHVLLDLVDSLVSQLLEGSSSGPLNGGVWLTPMISHESLSVFWHTEDGR